MESKFIKGSKILKTNIFVCQVENFMKLATVEQIQVSQTRDSNLCTDPPTKGRTDEKKSSLSIFH